MAILSLSILLTGCKKDDDHHYGTLQLLKVTAAGETLSLQGSTGNISPTGPFLVIFTDALDTASAGDAIRIEKKSDGSEFASLCSFSNDRKTAILSLPEELSPETAYLLIIGQSLRGANKETFTGLIIEFTTAPGKLTIQSITLNGANIQSTPPLFEVDREYVQFDIIFSHALDPGGYQSFFTLSGGIPFEFNLSNENKSLTITNAETLAGYTTYYFNIRNDLTAANGFTFDGFSNSFITTLDSAYKFPLITDEQLLDLIQEKTFQYFYDFAHPTAGLARERNSSGDIVTIGGSGFGVMALIVGMERNFIARADGLAHLEKILTFLETCDRFHGAWPHWLFGSTGEVHPFSENDDGADLVETGFMIQGLMTMRQYLDAGNPGEDLLIGRINDLMDAVEYDWFTRGQNVLYWHWSPNVGWAMNMKIEGHNETQVVYVMAATSTTHPVSAEVYHQGYARNGAIVNGNSYYGIPLPLGWAYGGPLFFTHYSYLGIDPRNLSDDYANYWEQNVNHTLINRAYCIANPHHYPGYSADCWGLTASDNPWGYSAHSPTNDLGVITPSAAVSALPYATEESMQAIRHFYYLLGDKLWGPYGFYDAFCVEQGWWADSYIAIDQGPIICMIENYRSGLLWDLFMSSPEVQQGLNKLGFSF